jgi:hypothetical protein
MAENCYTLITDIGKAKIANSIPMGTKVNFTKFKVGDSKGVYYEPTESQTDLVNTKWEGPIGSVYVDEDNPNWIVVDTVLPADIGGFYIREAGIFDENNNLIAISKLSESYKPVFEDGTTKEMLIRLILEVSNTSTISLKVDPTVILATQKDIKTLTGSINLINAQLSDMTNKSKVYQTTNSGNAYALTVPNLTSLSDGYALKVKFNAASTGNITVNPNSLGAKDVVDYFGNKVNNVRKDLIANLIYDATNGNFQLLGKGGGGNLTSGDLLINKTATGNNGLVTGSMPENGQLNANLNCGQSFNVPSGHVSGGTIIANNLASQTPANASSAQILSGFSAWVNGSLINGQATIANIGGRQFASNTAIVGSTIYKVYSPNGVNTNAKLISVSGLNFTPSVVFGYVQSKPTNRFYWHSSLPDYITLIIDYGYSQPWANVSIASTKSTVALGVNGGSFVMPLNSDGVSSGESIIWFAYS